ncbi:hypothetical protein SAMN04487950_3845 [Halogranum rubrum]|uniref:Uncharacterized protein n=2 Tax=Halogranum rubrum TaxID=553466 RepID=A0A1I4HVH0_9EURY|nr:hypothetical protein SAMN04487950_3845 [Halogranum rubrum]
MHLSQALSRTDDAEVQAYLHAALESAEALPPTPLVECPVCGKVGLPERIEMHDC